MALNLGWVWAAWSVRCAEMHHGQLCLFLNCVQVCGLSAWGFQSFVFFQTEMKKGKGPFKGRLWGRSRAWLWAPAWRPPGVVASETLWAPSTGGLEGKPALLADVWLSLIEMCGFICPLHTVCPLTLHFTLQEVSGLLVKAVSWRISGQLCVCETAFFSNARCILSLNCMLSMSIQLSGFICTEKRSSWSWDQTSLGRMRAQTKWERCLQLALHCKHTLGKEAVCRKTATWLTRDGVVLR